MVESKTTHRDATVMGLKHGDVGRPTGQHTGMADKGTGVAF